MEKYLPRSIRRLAELLGELPSLGPRQAIRLAMYLGQREANFKRELAEALRGLTELKSCAQCFLTHEEKDILCSFCANKERQQTIIAIVEKDTDLLAIENTGKFKGRYFVLGGLDRHGLLNELQKMRLEVLRSFIMKDLGGQAEELILALNPTRQADVYTELIEKQFQGLTKKITRLGRGLPRGGEVEFADDETLGESLRGRN